MSQGRAKLFQNGGSQAVRLPKECRFADGESEVLVRREGRCVILEPVDEWPSRFVRSLKAWSEDIERPEQARIEEAEDPFQ